MAWPKGKPRHPNSGRKPGSINRRSQEIAARAAAEGVSPLEVMLATMRDLWAQASETDSPAQGQSLRLAAAGIAEKAAPYMHARLANTTVNATVRRNLTDFADAELAVIAGEDEGEDGAIEAPGRPH